MCEQQQEGGLGMAIGATLTEELVLRDGKPLNPNFTDYKIVTVNEIPTLATGKTDYPAITKQVTLSN
jgi:CO/xanthine dehydrogenase Mo-binding subunit